MRDNHLFIEFGLSFLFDFHFGFMVNQFSKKYNKEDPVFTTEIMESLAFQFIF